MAVEDLIPQVAAGKFTAKVIGFLVLGIVGLAACSYVIWKVFFAERSAEAKHNQVQTEATIGAAKAGQESGKEAVKITIDNSKAAAGVDRAVKEALDAIAKVKGSDQQLDPALDDLGRRSVCVRASAAGLPDCQPVQRTDP